MGYAGIYRHIEESYADYCILDYYHSIASHWIEGSPETIFLIIKRPAPFVSGKSNFTEWRRPCLLSKFAKDFLRYP